MKPFTYRGVWWLPSKEEQKIVGEATFVGNEQPKLVLHGAFDHDFKPGPIELSWCPLILGKTETGFPITLFNCRETSLSGGFGENAEEQEIQAEVAFVGTHFSDQQDILFDTIDVYYKYLPQWAGLFPYRGYQTVFSDLTANILKGTIIVQLVTTAWDELTKEASLIKEADLPDIVRIRFEIHEALSLEQWGEQFIAPFQHLISLATQRPNAPVNIVGYVKPDRTEPLQEALGVPIQIASPLAIVPIAARKPSFPPTILFSLQDITPNFSDLIETWLNMADELNSSYKLFFGVQYTSLPLDLQFLLIAQATEIYQDKRFDAPPFPKDDYQNLLQQLLTACPNEEYNEWLKDTLEDRNNTTYRQQLRNLVKRTYTVLHPILGENTKKRNEFVEIAYNTRNYLTHHTPELALRSASGIELLYMTRSLSLTLQVCWMEELGFSSQHLAEIIHRHEDYQLLHFLQSQIELKKLIHPSSR